jgi:hypothetical protein
MLSTWMLPRTRGVVDDDPDMQMALILLLLGTVFQRHCCEELVETIMKNNGAKLASLKSVACLRQKIFCWNNNDPVDCFQCQRVD